MTPIIKSGGEVRAYVHQVGNRKELIAKGGRLIGFYDSEKDQTILSGGRLYGLGDQLMSLLPEDD